MSAGESELKSCNKCNNDTTDVSENQTTKSDTTMQIVNYAVESHK